MEYKPKSRRADDSLLRVNRKGPSAQQSVGPDLSYKPAPLLPNPHVSPRQLHLQRTEKQLTDFTLSPMVAQRQALAPMLEGLQLQREILGTAGHSSHRQTLQRQIEVHQASLGTGQLQARQYEAAVQRQADLQTPVAPLTQRPSSPAQWSQGGQWEVQRVADPSKPGQTISLREQEQSQHLGLLRTVGIQLGQGFRTDTGPAVQRYAEYGEALAPFQRLGTGTGRAVVTTALMQVPVSQRSALQRAIDETIQRQQAQETQDRAIIGLHSLQRQLDHLDGQPEQPLMERIQARRGAGNPIPTALRKALELELNHDLGAVRIHDDAEADHLSKKVNAVAFTTGQDIFFRAGTFNPNTRTGVELIAHEVTHTRQQAHGKAKPGIDSDAGLEMEARSFGTGFASGHFVGPTARLSQGKRQPGRQFMSQHAAGWAVQRRAGPPPVTTPKVLPTGGKLAVIKHLDGANLHASPHGSGPTSALLPLGTKLSELSKTADGWSRVVTAHGQQGYVQSLRLTTDLPDAGASLIKVEAGTTAIGIAERYYKALVKSGQDLRFYVNVLIDLDQRRGTGAFQSGQTLKAGQALWVPGPALAQSLVGQVGSGSYTGGMWARAKEAIGNGPGANILRSVLESPPYIPEMLGELWAQVKEHWALILGTTVALVGAELLVGALAAAPEPTTITKFLAVGLQGLITAVAGAGLAIGVAQAAKAGTRWLMQAWIADGDAGKLKAASKSFLVMVGNLIVALASVAGVRASAVKTGALKGLYTSEQLIAQIGSKATYDVLMNTLKSRGVTKNNAQLLGQFLKKVPDPLELKGWLRKVGKPEEFLATLEQYPLNRIRTALAEVDAQSVPPDQALDLLRLKLKYPVPTRPMTPARMGRLQAEYGAEARDKMYGGRANVPLKDLSPGALAADKQAGVAYRQLLTKLLDESEYVYRFTNDYAFYDVALGGKVPANARGFQSAFMTNVPSPNGFEAALGAQIKPQWARFTDGVPTLMVRIPRRALQGVSVPRPSGNTPGFAGWELTTSAYPEAGRGGALQFMGDIDGATLRALFEAGEVRATPLTSPIKGRLPVPKTPGVKP